MVNEPISLDEALKIIEEERLSDYRNYSFDGLIEPNVIGVRLIDGVWEVYSVDGRETVKRVAKYRYQEVAIGHMIRLLRLEKKIGAKKDMRSGVTGKRLR